MPGLASREGRLSFVHIGVMPLQEFGGGLVGGVGGKADCAAVVAVVIAAVIELFFDAAAYFDVHGRGDGDVAFVEQCVEVAPEKQAIADEVLAAFGVGLDVRGIEGGESAFVGHGAAAFVGVRDQHAEGALAQAGERENGRAVLRSAALGHGNGRRHGELQMFQQGNAGLSGQVVGAALNDVGFPVRGNRNP